MQLTTLDCNNCGAPLEVSDSTQYVSCGHCGAQLVVRRTSNSAFTEILDEMLQRLTRIERQNELVDLEREWEEEKQSYLIQGKNGVSHIPTHFHAGMSGVVGLFGLFWTIFAGAAFPPMAIFGLLFIGFAIFNAVRTMQKADAYEKALERYQLKRAKLKHEASTANEARD